MNLFYPGRMQAKSIYCMATRFGLKTSQDGTSFCIYNVNFWPHFEFQHGNKHRFKETSQDGAIYCIYNVTFWPHFEFQHGNKHRFNGWRVSHSQPGRWYRGQVFAFIMRLFGPILNFNMEEASQDGASFCI